MRIDQVLLAFTLMGSAAASVIDNGKIARADVETDNELYKRRGGGGGGGRGGGSSGGSKGSGSGSGSSGGSKGSGSGSSSGGVRPSYGGGKYYGGGAATPYRSGGRSAGGLVPFLFIGGALAFWPGVWLYGANLYPYNHHLNNRNDDDDDDDDTYVYKFHNDTSDEDEEREVICACAQYADSCGCDKNDDSEAYLDELIGDGDYDKLNKTLVNVADVNGTMTILINGTLPNGTTVDDEDNLGGNSMRSMVEALGFWPAIAAVTAAVFLA